MDETSLVAEGTDSKVEVAGGKVVVRRRGVKTMLVRGYALYRDPRSLARAFEGPSKKVIMTALVENKELARVIMGAVKGPASAEDSGGLGKALTEALKHNRQAVVDAIRSNDALVKAWLRDHKDLAGIVLKGDVHVFVADVSSVALTSRKDGRRVFILVADGEHVSVPYDQSREEQFRRLCHALAGDAKPVAPLPPPADPAPADPAPAGPAPAGPAPADPAPADRPPAATPSGSGAPAGSSAPETKTCPMCAEDVKAAALICRFCGYQFDQTG